MEKLRIVLEHEEMDALIALAQSEKRDPRYQAALIIRVELERRGLLPMESITITDRHHGDEKAELAALMKAAAEKATND